MITDEFTGGGDYPEAVEDALHALNSMSWGIHACKVAIIVGDAPPHGAGDENDAFPLGFVAKLFNINHLHRVSSWI